ncbi:MAG TPA: hypothetical protein VF186_04570 [Gaiellaceae bacterium]
MRLHGTRALLVVPAAALLVHQLRYTLAYGPRASAELAAQGHSYLHSLVPWMILALGVALSSFLLRAAHAARTGETGRLARASAPALWAVTTGALLALYALQEGLEELFSAGHPTGAAGIVGNGGWWALPASAAVAVLVVALLRLGRAVLRLAARRARRAPRLRPAAVRLPLAVRLVPAAPLALAAAGRAPPHA